MFHQRCNELRLTLRLEPAAPLLIKAGEDPQDYLAPESNAEADQTPFGEMVKREQQEIVWRTAAEKARREREKQKRDDNRKQKDKLDLDMTFVRTWRNGVEEPYLPGSSLKGVLRSRCEQLAATFGDPDEVCNILDQEGKSSGRLSCTKVVENVADFQERYRTACPICKLFGCGGLASRLAVSDAYLVGRLQSDSFTTRSGVGINRQRGAAESGALFFYEALQKGVFRLTLTLENFELWQLGLTAYALDELLHGRLPVGYGSRRGLGLLRGSVEAATLTYFGRESYRIDDGCHLLGVAGLTSELGSQYDFVAENSPVVLSGTTLNARGLRQTWTLPDPAVETMWQAGAQAWMNTWTREGAVA